ncbi:hypothetical protein T492DRAFT_147419 [Pavlovales sp. CCMP2436]|nr:hypothetical protein T492DRAFT_147419 [Pavlovales sp. CCMP2436]
MCEDEERVGTFSLQLAPLRAEVSACLEARAANLLALVRTEVVGAISALRNEAERTSVLLRIMPESADHLHHLRSTIDRVTAGSHELLAHVRALSALCSFLEAHGCELTPKQQALRWEVFGLPSEISTWLPKANVLFRRMRSEFKENYHAEREHFDARVRALLTEKGPAALDLDGLARASEHYDAVRAALNELELCESALERISRHAHLFQSPPTDCAPALALLRERLAPRAQLWDIAAEWADADRPTAALLASTQLEGVDDLAERFLAGGPDDVFALRAARDLRSQLARRRDAQSPL